LKGAATWNSQVLLWKINMCGPGEWMDPSSFLTNRFSFRFPFLKNALLTTSNIQLVIQRKIEAYQGSICSLLNVHGQMLSASYDHSIHIWNQHVVSIACIWYVF